MTWECVATVEEGGLVWARRRWRRCGGVWCGGVRWCVRVGVGWVGGVYLGVGDEELGDGDARHERPRRAQVLELEVQRRRLLRRPAPAPNSRSGQTAAVVKQPQWSNPALRYSAAAFSAAPHLPPVPPRGNLRRLDGSVAGIFTPPTPPLPLSLWARVCVCVNARGFLGEGGLGAHPARNSRTAPVVKQPQWSNSPSGQTAPVVEQPQWSNSPSGQTAPVVKQPQ